MSQDCNPNLFKNSRWSPKAIAYLLLQQALASLLAHGELGVVIRGQKAARVRSHHFVHPSTHLDPLDGWTNSRAALSIIFSASAFQLSEALMQKQRFQQFSGI